MRKPIKLTSPLAGRHVLVEGSIIDAAAVNRVVTLDGSCRSITLRDCEFINATSVLEGWCHDCLITLDGCDFRDVERYAFYGESKTDQLEKITGRVSNLLLVRRCTFASSRTETAVRAEYGFGAWIADTKFRDVVDRYANKANMALRLECETAVVERCRIEGGTKLGNAANPARSIVCSDVDFDGHFASQGARYIDFDRCSWRA